MMQLVFAILCALGAVALFLLIGFANMMSDNPGEQASYWPSAVPLAFAGLLFASWYWGW